MDLYTLNENFLPRSPVDQYVSAIWTERYTAAGDCQLVVAPTDDNLAMLAPGTLLAMRGTKTVMELNYTEIKDGLATIKGTDLLYFLNNRMAWFRNPSDAAVGEGERIVDYTLEEAKAGEFIADVVNKTVINPVDFTGQYVPVNLDWDLDKLPFLTLGEVDHTGTAERQTATVGPLYDSIQQIAAKAGVGIRLYLYTASEDTGYVLHFDTYQGKDRTSTQEVNPLVRLSPDMDTLNGLTEIHSNALYKNVAYVIYKGIITQHYAEPTLPAPEGLFRRVLVTNPETEPVGRKVDRRNYSAGFGWVPTVETVVGPDEIAAFREQNAKDALANNNYILAVDGQTSPDSEYQYGRDYGLGDLIELKGLTGAISQARVTEYIRSRDTSGEKAYPTISVVTPEGV